MLFGVLIAEKVDGVEGSHQNGTQWSKYRHSWRPFWTCSWYLPVSPKRLSSGKKQNFWSWNCSPQVLDDQNIWIIGSVVKGILLYITKMILQNLQKCTTYNVDKSNFHTNLKHHTTPQTMNT